MRDVNRFSRDIRQRPRCAWCASPAIEEIAVERDEGASAVLDVCRDHLRVLKIRAGSGRRLLRASKLAASSGS